MNLSRRTAWKLVLLYAVLVYSGLYFTPFVGEFLEKKEALGSVVWWTYGIVGIVFFFFSYVKLGIRSPTAYGMLAVLIILFFAAIGRMFVTTDRFHFLEHGIMYLLIYLALRFSHEGILLVGRTLLLCVLFALLDEGLQGFLPNRHAEWTDVWTNIFSYYLAMGIVVVILHYRRARV